MATAKEVANFVSAWQSAVNDGYTASNPAPSGYEASHTATLPNAPSGDSYVWNRLGERIGATAHGQGYTDYSAGASNAIVNSEDVWKGVTPTNQRYLTATNGLEPSFMDYNKLPTLANSWMQNNPGSSWDPKSLTDLWKSKYGDTSSIPGLMQKYGNEFGNPPQLGLLPQGSANPLPMLQPQSQSGSASSLSQTELDRLGDVYKAKMAVGDIAGANEAHEQANRIREAMGLKAGVNYDPITGANIEGWDGVVLFPEKPAETTVLSILQDALTGKGQQNLLPTLPEPSDYQMKPFEYEAPSYSVTSDPSQTSFIPTARAKDRWLQQEKANADQAYRDYTARAGNWDRQYRAGQDTISNALSLLPMTELTAAQRAEIDYQTAQAKAAADKAANDEKWRQMEYDLDKQKVDYTTSKPHYKPDNDPSASSAPKPSKVKNDYIGNIIETRKTPKDAAAQLQRDEERLMRLGLTQYDIAQLKKYIDSWANQFDSGSRGYGRNYQPPN